jgi:hypothetical protein
VERGTQKGIKRQFFSQIWEEKKHTEKEKRKFNSIFFVSLKTIFLKR